MIWSTSEMFCRMVLSLRTTQANLASRSASSPPEPPPRPPYHDFHLWLAAAGDVMLEHTGSALNAISWHRKRHSFVKQNITDENINQFRVILGLPIGHSFDIADCLRNLNPIGSRLEIDAVNSLSCPTSMHKERWLNEVDKPFVVHVGWQVSRLDPFKLFGRETRSERNGRNLAKRLALPIVWLNDHYLPFYSRESQNP
jgi:hypothetical protein